MSLVAAQKFITSLVIAGAAAAALFIAFDPGLTQALVVLVPAVFGAIAVFSTANSSEADWAKAAAQLQAASLSVVGFFVTVPTDTPEKISAVVVAAISSYFVYKVRNQ